MRYLLVLLFLPCAIAFSQIESYLYEGDVVSYEVMVSPSIDWGPPPPANEVKLRLSMYTYRAGYFRDYEVVMSIHNGLDTTYKRYEGYYRIENFGNQFRESVTCNIPMEDMLLIRKADIVRVVIGNDIRHFLFWNDRSNL
jgi:hypothetical protein